jgi:aspartyl/asparaginyl beta-hydroxylase (cupin superfamily)
MFFDPALFPEFKLLQENWQVIKDELVGLASERLLTTEVFKHNDWIGKRLFRFSFILSFSSRFCAARTMC